jgi:hypothetical protein
MKFKLIIVVSVQFMELVIILVVFPKMKFKLIIVGSVQFMDPVIR